MKDNDIDKKLKEWNANIALSRDKGDQIKKNIMDNLDKPVANTDYRFEDPYFHIHKKVVYFAGIAASLCFAFLLGTQYNMRNSNIIGNTASSLKPEQTPVLATLSRDDIIALKRLSKEVDYLFPGGVKAVTQHDDGNIDINTEERKGIDDTGKVAIRYVVLKKKTGEKNWTRVRVSDIIVPGGEPLELNGKDKGHIWVYPADKNVYAVETNLKIRANGETINLNYIGGQELRTPQNIKTIINADSEYKVYQTLVKI